MARVTFAILITLVWYCARVHAQLTISYPAWRGSGLAANATFPFATQGESPCGGLPARQRTPWPLNHGVLAFQPARFAGNPRAATHVNIQVGEVLGSEWTALQPAFDVLAPSDPSVTSALCLPNVMVPASLRVRSGDSATLQIVQLTESSGVLYSCADIVFTDDASTVPPIDERTCFNSTAVRVFDDPSDEGITTTPRPTTTGQDMWGWACNPTATARRQLFESMATFCSSSSANGPTETAAPAVTNVPSKASRKIGNEAWPAVVLAVGLWVPWMA